MSHIFISYSKNNIEFARYLRALLESEGFPVWMDEEQLVASARWWKSIESSIESCSAFVVIMSPDAAESDWVEREILLAESKKRPIFPVLLTGSAWSRLANIQYEDLRAGLHARLSARLIEALRQRLPVTSPLRRVAFTIQQGDITAFEADVAAFKYAHAFHGADNVVASLLNDRINLNMDSLRAPEDEYRLVSTGGSLPFAHVLYLGMPPLRFIGYAQLREFGARSLTALAEAAPRTRHVAMTIHGPGFSRDERESFLSQFAGLRDAMQAGTLPPALQQITIVDRVADRVTRLRELLEETLVGADYAVPFTAGWGYHLTIPDTAAPLESEPAALQSAGTTAEKPHAFVIMPLHAENEDFYTYGVQGAVHAHALLCETNLNPDPQAADSALEIARARIDTARVVIVDLTAADALTCLQLGYAWGRGVPTLLLLKHNHAAPIPASAPPIVYNRIKDLESGLLQALDQLKEQGLL